MKNIDVEYGEHKGRKVFLASNLGTIYRLAKHYGIKEAKPILENGEKTGVYILLIPEPFENFYSNNVFLDSFTLLETCIN